MNILEWPSIDAYLDDATPAAKALRMSGGYSHSQIVKVEEVSRLARFGDPDLYKRASAVLADFEAQTATDDRPRWDHHVAGGSLSIGRYVQGHPQCMNRRITTQTDFRQIRIVVNTGLSGGVSGAAAHMRAAMIIGLLNKLTAEGVDLDLYLYEDGMAPAEGLAPRLQNTTWAKRLRQSDLSRDYCQMVKLDTRPVNMAQACYLLTQPEVFGSLMLPAAIGGFVGSDASHWPYHETSWGKPEWIRKSREMLGMGPHDLYIASFNLAETSLSPQAWIDKYARQALDGVAVAA